MAVPSGQIRAAAQLLIRAAAAQKLSAAETIRQLKAKGLSYRRTTMLADWRNLSNIKKKEGLMRYVRKDRMPTAEIAVVKEWKLSREYKFICRVRSRLAPGEPIEERFISVMADRPLTPREIETEVIESWGKWYPEKREEVERVIPETAIRRG